MKKIGIKYIIIGVSAILSVVLIYYFIDPIASAWLPKCIFKQLTGFDCPACGTQRALHAFLNGNIADALHYNPFMIISIPYFAAVLYTTIWESTTATRLRRYVQHSCTILTFLALLIIWWIVRNIHLQ
ncbi:MAG: DUF2752 domain-containing protein [Bacteroidaceae bacterium]|nr:DUF2752 domain-containing protein [Bacteroidaceae bacterium]